MSGKFDRQSWRSLRVGERVRLLGMPPEFSQPGYYLHSDTRRVYRLLVKRGRSLRVRRIDEYGAPWAECRFRKRNGSVDRHWLAFTHDGWIKVQRKKGALPPARPDT